LTKPIPKNAAITVIKIFAS